MQRHLSARDSFHKTAIVSRAALALIIFGAWSAALAQASVGRDAPEFLVKDLAGHEVRLSEFGGKVVIVTFWASWCSPCFKELPILENIQTAAGTGRLAVIAINLKESRRRFRATAREVSESPLILTHDPRGYIADQFGVRGIPYTVLIAKSGRIAFVHLGFNDELVEQLVDETNQLLSEVQTSSM